MTSGAEQKKVRIAIIGLGKVANDIHIPACQLLDEISLVAGCEPDKARGEAIKSKFNIPNIYTDAKEMLEKEKPDLVIIGTPPNSHRDLAILSLQSNVDVLCEKPFALSIEEADQVIAQARASNRVVAVNNQYRYMNHYRISKEMVDTGEIGKPYFLQCWQQMYHPPTQEKTAWRNVLKQSTLFEFGSHPLDLICHFFGALPESVHAVVPQFAGQYDSDVLVQMTLRFPGDRLATMALNRVSRAPERYLEMRLDCEKASLRLSLGGVARAGMELTRHHGRLYPRMRFSLVKGGEARLEAEGKSTVIAREQQPAFASATAAHLRKMIEMRRSGNIEYKGIEHAREILRIIFAGYESAETNQVVSLKPAQTTGTANGAAEPISQTNAAPGNLSGNPKQAAPAEKTG